MNTTRQLLATIALMLAAPLAALAQPDGNGPPPDHEGGHHRGPPPEAIAACQGKAVGSQASFTDREGRTVTGACVQRGDVVAVAPPHHHGEHGGAASQPRP